MSLAQRRPRNPARQPFGRDAALTKVEETPTGEILLPSRGVLYDPFLYGQKIPKTVSVTTVVGARRPLVAGVKNPQNPAESTRPLHLPSGPARVLPCRAHLTRETLHGEGRSRGSTESTLHTDSSCFLSLQQQSSKGCFQPVFPSIMFPYSSANLHSPPAATHM